LPDGFDTTPAPAVARVLAILNAYPLGMTGQNNAKVSTLEFYHAGSMRRCSWRRREAGANQEGDRLIGSFRGKQQAGMRCGNDAVICQARQLRLGDADRPIMRRVQCADRKAETYRQPSGDCADRLWTVPALDAVAEHLQILADDVAAAGKTSHSTRNGAAAQRRADAHDAPAREFRFALRGLQGDQATKTVTDKVNFSISCGSHSPQQKVDARFRTVKHAGVIENIDRVPSALEAMAQRNQGKGAHPQAVQEDYMLNHGKRYSPSTGHCSLFSPRRARLRPGCPHVLKEQSQGPHRLASSAHRIQEPVDTCDECHCQDNFQRSERICISGIRRQ